MGAWLARKGLLPDHVFSSPATRAIETARKGCKAGGMRSDGIQGDPRIYQASPEQLVELLTRSPPQAGRVLLVGHNPELEELVEWLTGEPLPVGKSGKRLPAGTLVRLEIASGWSTLSRGAASLVEVVHPKSLPEKFPYPFPDGPEHRDRPAYYYRQSSVIPFRVVDGRMEVLVVSSSSGRKTVVPKGIHEPGLSAQESAAIEAWEEGGAEGEVLDEAIGDYRYAKWGAECSVKVYPMRVTRVVADEEWEESHRKRRWLSPKQAAKQLTQPALGPMVLELERIICGQD
jgi:phosphohistidine phosphatase